MSQLDAAVTTMIDWCHNNATPAHTDAAVDGLPENGIRALFLHGSPKPDPKPGQRHFSEIPHPRAEIERPARGRIGGRDGRVGLGMAILSPAYSTYEVSRHDVALARELAMICSMHVGGGAMRTPDGFPRLVAEGLIDDRINIVHGNSLADETLRQLVESGAGVTVSPDGELQMGFGDCLTGRLRALGAAPSLGSDEESSLGSDMFTVMRIALHSQRNLDNQQALARTGRGRSASRSSAARRSFGRRWPARMAGLDDRIGSLRPGKEADIVLLRANDLVLLPVVDPLASIVLHAGAANVDTVLVAGQVAKRDGKLLYRDLARRKAELAESSGRVLGAARLH